MKEQGNILILQYVEWPGMFSSVTNAPKYKLVSNMEEILWEFVNKGLYLNVTLEISFYLFSFKRYVTIRFTA